MHLSVAPVAINVTYRSTIRADRQCGRIRAVVQLQVVVLAISRVIYAELLEGDRHQTTSGCPDEPLTVGAVTVGVWIVGTCKRAVVTKKSAATTCWESTLTPHHLKSRKQKAFGIVQSQFVFTIQTNCHHCHPPESNVIGPWGDDVHVASKPSRALEKSLLKCK